MRGFDDYLTDQDRWRDTRQPYVMSADDERVVELLGEAVEMVQSGFDAIPTLDEALALLRAQAGELPRAEVVDEECE